MTRTDRDYRQATPAELRAERRRIDAARAGHPTADHDVHIWNQPGGHSWMAECDCGWQSPAPVLSEHAARELAASHYMLDGGSGDNDSRGLLAAMQRHPAGSASKVER